MEEHYPVVIDNGSGVSKCGLSGDDAPRIVFPSLIGRSKKSFIDNSTRIYVGDETNMKGVHTVTSPIQRGLFTDWNDAEKIWSHSLYDELRVNPKEQSILLTEIPFNPKSYREKMAQIMFESFSVPGLYIMNQSLLALYASGRYNGIVLDSGDGITHAVPIFEGHTLTGAISRWDFAGSDVSAHLVTMMRKIVDLSEYNEYNIRYIVNKIKEQCCHVVFDFELEVQMNNNNESTSSSSSAGSSTGSSTVKYELPDGNVITIGNECFKCAEALFQPKIVGLDDQLGLAELVYTSIEKCNSDERRNLYGNIILSGGNTLFRGITERMCKEMVKLYSYDTVRVVGPPERAFSAWIGGSIVASLSLFPSMCISKKEYEEFGSGICRRKLC